MLNYKNLEGVAPKLRDALGITQLPSIRGDWYFVDPYGATYPVELPGQIVRTIKEAYDLCVSGRGDGIAIVSGGTTSAHTTGYISAPITWSKWGITTIGLCAPTRFAQRSRIVDVVHTTGAITTLAFPTATTITDSASGFVTAGFAVGDILSIDTTSNTNDGTTAIVTAVAAGTLTCAASNFTIENAATAGATTIKSWCSKLISVTGSNNSFYNLSFYNGGALGAGGVEVDGDRNYFENCHFMGGMGMTTPAITDYSLKLTGASECTFVNCVIGSDTFNKTDIAGTELMVDRDASMSGCMRIRFYDCEFISFRSAGTTAGLVKLNTTGDSITRTMVFDNCFFHMYRDGAATAEASVVIGTAPNNGFIIFKDCQRHGFTDWAGVATNRVYSASVSGAEAGGITIVCNPS